MKFTKNILLEILGNDIQIVECIARVGSVQFNSLFEKKSVVSGFQLCMGFIHSHYRRKTELRQYKNAVHIWVNFIWAYKPNHRTRPFNHELIWIKQNNNEK